MLSKGVPHLSALGTQTPENGCMMLVPLVFLKEWETGGSTCPPLTSHNSFRASKGDLLRDLSDVSVDSSFRYAVELRVSHQACLAA